MELRLWLCTPCSPCSLGWVEDLSAKSRMGQDGFGILGHPVSRTEHPVAPVCTEVLRNRGCLCRGVAGRVLPQSGAPSTVPSLHGGRSLHAAGATAAGQGGTG